ncbi:MAG TPA: TIGR02530 family flagellar biosynthesis protein [Patescibacteria group bacterium]|nr:TIGR02530 family flagellar biosynthesis protein [Patescibacteria group bacterium]
MTDKLTGVQPYQPQLLNINRVPVVSTNNSPGKASSSSQGSFAAALQQELTGVKFSQHALQRLQARNLELNNEQLGKLSEAIDKAALKGAKESLVVMNDLALVVSIKNRTVITAMDTQAMKDNVVTNIDSAVIV